MHVGKYLDPPIGIAVTRVLVREGLFAIALVVANKRVALVATRDDAAARVADWPLERTLMPVEEPACLSKQARKYVGLSQS